MYNRLSRSVERVYFPAPECPHTLRQERLNGVLRDRLACLTRKTHAFAKRPRTWDAAVGLSGDSQSPSATGMLRSRPRRLARLMGEPLKRALNCSCGIVIHSMSEGPSTPSRGRKAASRVTCTNLTLSNGHTSWEVCQPYIYPSGDTGPNPGVLTPNRRSMITVGTVGARCDLGPGLRSESRTWCRSGRVRKLVDFPQFERRRRPFGRIELAQQPARMWHTRNCCVRTPPLCYRC